MNRFLLLLLLSAGVAVGSAQVEKVNMSIGQKGNSNCVIGPQLPHGSINPSPDTPNGGQDGYDERQPIRGFSQLHVQGTGWGRYGQLLLSPQTATFTSDEAGHDSDKAEEQATPYYYKVRLKRYGVLVEITPTHHAALYRLTYPARYVADGTASLLLDICHNIPEHVYPAINGRYLGGEIKYDPTERLITGYGEYMGGFGSADSYRVYFAMSSDNVDFSKAQIQQTAYDNGRVKTRKYAKIPVEVNVADVRIAVSMRSVDNAKRFLREETDGKDFATVAENGRQVWNNTLGRIKIDAQTDEEAELFYTSLYFSHVMPRDRADDNPRWLGENYDDHYCVWDTWRTKYPLMTLLDEQFVARTITSFINRYESDGVCNPTFTAALDWAERQGGDDNTNIIADAMVKGIKGFDYKKAYAYVKDYALSRRSPEYLRLGWQPENGGIMACSNALEYAYNDYCAYEVAMIMGDKSFADKMLERSKSWTKLFNPEQKDENAEFRGFIVPRKEDGRFIDIPVRKSYASWVEYFYEGNSWTYSLFIPHDFERLISLCGGRDEMIRRLEYGFNHELIALWNEPGFLSPFIFHHCGRPELSAKYVSMLRQKNYSLENGFCDNEDSGAMGSWFVFTGLGLFPNAGQDYYYVLPPAYAEATLQLANGRQLHITRDITCYPFTKVKAVYLNGRLQKGFTLRHADIMKGGELKFVLE